MAKIPVKYQKTQQFSTHNLESLSIDVLKTQILKSNSLVKSRVRTLKAKGYDISNQSFYKNFDGEKFDSGLGWQKPTKKQLADALKEMRTFLNDPYNSFVSLNKFRKDINIRTKELGMLSYDTEISRRVSEYVEKEFAKGNYAIDLVKAEKKIRRQVSRPAINNLTHKQFNQLTVSVRTMYKYGIKGKIMDQIGNIDTNDLNGVFYEASQLKSEDMEKMLKKFYGENYNKENDETQKIVDFITARMNENISMEESKMSYREKTYILNEKASQSLFK